jgi:hypothetical protein
MTSKTRTAFATFVGLLVVAGVTMTSGAETGRFRRRGGSRNCHAEAAPAAEDKLGEVC